jgi:hypothetical protein
MCDLDPGYCAVCDQGTVFSLKEDTRFSNFQGCLTDDNGPRKLHGCKRKTKDGVSGKLCGCMGVDLCNGECYDKDNCNLPDEESADPVNLVQLSAEKPDENSDRWAKLLGDGENSTDSGKTNETFVPENNDEDFNNPFARRNKPKPTSTPMTTTTKKHGKSKTTVSSARAMRKKI